MPASPKSPSSSREKVARHRARRRADGMRLVQFWVPDTRDPAVRAELGRQIATFDPDDEEETMRWIEANSIFDSEWPRDDDASR